ncbi:hypothetical protein OJAV_G00185250 [Oryzias javanicus]|uniref:Uncharacterized protein n=1 Tax=Oryzias javanicus TaxID=123683 RepID=A0A437CDH6_ORYJA|nr:hypothetical protein OJAV_G00185250 [Oryzias javanicus]
MGQRTSVPRFPPESEALRHPSGGSQSRKSHLHIWIVRTGVERGAWPQKLLWFTEESDGESEQNGRENGESVDNPRENDAVL